MPSPAMPDESRGRASTIDEIRELVRRTAGDVPDLRFAVLNASTGLFLSNMRGREASEMAKLALGLMPLLRVGDFAVKVDNKGASTLVFRADEKIAIILGGAWRSPGLMSVCARSIYAHVRDILLTEPGESYVPLVAEGREIELRLEPAPLTFLSYIDGEMGLGDLTASVGVDETEAKMILNMLREAGAVLFSLSSREKRRGLGLRL